MTPFCLKYSNGACSQCEDNYVLNGGKCNLNTIYTQNTLYENYIKAKKNVISS